MDDWVSAELTFTQPFCSEAIKQLSGLMSRFLRVSDKLIVVPPKEDELVLVKSPSTQIDMALRTSRYALSSRSNDASLLE